MHSEIISLTIWIFSILLFISTIIVAVVVISENRSPVRSLAWLTVLTVIPFFGLILYFVFGRNVKNKRATISRNMKRRLRRKEKSIKPDFDRLNLSEISKQIMRVGSMLDGAGIHKNNEAEIFTSGKKKFESLFNDLESARRYIFIEYYIIENDEIGKKLTEILCTKAAAGVKVFLIYDPIGCSSAGKKFFKVMEMAGVRVKPFIPVRFPKFGTKINWRNHRKQVVIDGHIAYVGGMNLAKRYADGGKEFNSWRDLHLRLMGRIVASVETSFITDWSFMGDNSDILPALDESALDTNGELMMQLVTTGPTSQWYNIELLYLKAIGGATKRIYIETPYFLPPESLLNALQTASLGGVDVRILMPRRSDSMILTLAASSYVSACLKAGIKVYVYEKGMLHSKMLLIDDDLVSIGSTNFDFRSFEHNFEETLFIYSEDFNRKMRDIFRETLMDSTRILTENWMKRSPIRKFTESVMRLLAPIL